MNAILAANVICVYVPLIFVLLPYHRGECNIRIGKAFESLEMDVIYTR